MPILWLVLCGMVLLPVLPAAAETMLRWAMSSEPGSASPQHQHSVVEARLFGEVFEGLTRRMPDGSIGPAVASQWSSSPDLKTWTFILRPNARWQDDTPVTAADFIRGWRSILAAGGNGTRTPRALRQMVGADALMRGDRQADFGAKAPDPHRLVIQLQAPIAHYADYFSDETLMPMPPAGDDGATSRPVIGNGAYRLVSWTPHLRILLERSPTYWNADKVKIDKLDFEIIEDPAEQLRRFRIGDLDIADAVPLKQLSWIRSNLADQLRVTSGSGSWFLTINVSARPWSADQHVRRALSLAIDRSLLADHLLEGLYSPADTLVPPTVENYPGLGPPDWPPTQAAREAEARRLWALPGSPRPTRITVTFANFEIRRRVLLAIGEMWKRVLGVEIQLDNQESNKVFTRFAQHDYEVGYYNTNSYHAEGFLDRFGASSGVNNYANYHSPTVDALLQQSMLSTDVTQANRSLAMAEQEVLKDAVAIPLFQVRKYELISANVRGYKLAPAGHLIASDLEIFMQ